MLEGFTDWQIPDWARRLITRGLALIPALLGIMVLGDRAVGTLLVASQVLLSIALRSAILPLLRATSDPALMGPHTNGVFLRWCGWLPLLLIATADVRLLGSSLSTTG